MPSDVPELSQDQRMPRSAEFVGADGCAEFKSQYQTRIDPQHGGPLKMAHRDVGDRLPDAAAVPR